MRMLFIVGGLAMALVGCQSAEQSMSSAHNTCVQAGLKAGTARYNKCVNAAYASSRRQSQDATNAVVAGAAIADIGGALLGASTRRSGYYYLPYYRSYYRPVVVY